MATETAAVGLKLHIVVDKKKNRVLFAEAGKEFVDFIFHILSLPLGAVARIFSDTLNLGSIGSIREGMKNLHAKCFGESPGKEYLVDLVNAPYRGTQISQLLPQASFSKPHTFFRCSNNYNYMEMPCRYNTSNRCCFEVQIKGFLKDVAGSNDGYVNGWATFMVMDDLTVHASTAAAVFSVLGELPNNNVGGMEKREVTFGTNEAIKLLKASLTSKTVLTDVFLAGGAAVKAEN